MNTQYFILDNSGPYQFSAYDFNNTIHLCSNCDISSEFFHWNFKEYDSYKLFAIIDNFEFTQPMQVFDKICYKFSNGYLTKFLKISIISGFPKGGGSRNPTDFYIWLIIPSLIFEINFNAKTLRN